jgi:hypothetical protein
VLVPNFPEHPTEKHKAAGFITAYVGFRRHTLLEGNPSWSRSTMHVY